MLSKTVKLNLFTQVISIATQVNRTVQAYNSRILNSTLSNNGSFTIVINLLVNLAKYLYQPIDLN
jgi:hypothetical protein